MPIQPTISEWGVLLGAFRMHGKTKMGKITAEKLFELDDEYFGNHVV
ncbi:hypothetical protein MtrunA17_Chr1g0205291 [Medicago truncatula]|uniref:Uncharacterized protein n=1 Tax=Medicago truncatula TaxID=3880 RepID=A0A396JUM7_MEDTR|nr:hypothetical protein MtrunA17_Chr1g0205291 [Medicago truncatula]